MLRKFTGLILLASGVLAAGTAVAQGPPPEMQAMLDAVTKACAVEVQPKGVCEGKEGFDQIMCLATNQDKLSPGCKDAVSKLPPPPGG